MPKENSGRKYDQKMKPYLVYQYLLKRTDENHSESAQQIVEYLKEACGIEAERRSIYKDIDAINRALFILEEDITMDEIDEEYFDEDKAIVYDEHSKGFYVRKRHNEAADMLAFPICIMRLDSYSVTTLKYFALTLNATISVSSLMRSFGMWIFVSLFLQSLL